MADMDAVRRHYDMVLSARGEDLLATARTRDTEQSVPGEVREKMFNVAGEIKNRFHEFGSPIPPLLEGCTVLDLGCGSGRDTYLVAQLVGPAGKVIGYDPDPELLGIAEKYLDREMEQFGYSEANVEFVQGYPENLLSIADDSIDVVISNCILNMSPDKKAVLEEVRRVLVDGGEFYFTDVFTDRRVPEDLADDARWIAARLGGAMYIEDFRRLAQSCGFFDPRYVMAFKTPLSDEEREAFGEISFATITVRLLNTMLAEDICEAYGETITYLGNLPDYPDFFLFDKDIRFPAGQECTVCGNVTALAGGTRYSKAFKVTVDRSHHLGDIHGDHIIKTAADYEGIIDEDDQPIEASCC